MKTEKQYDWLVYIGRFQPVHEGHLNTIKQALELAENVLVIIGSASSPRTIKNPFSYHDRSDLINLSIPDESVNRVFIGGVPDFDYNDPAWIEAVGREMSYKTHGKVGIIGYKKDMSSEYLDYFPHYPFVPVNAYPKDGRPINATKVRELLLTGHKPFARSVLTKECLDFIENSIMNKPEWKTLTEEYQEHLESKKAWAGSPYPPTFNTVDAVVVQSGHVLLIKRKYSPGKGLWAIPGGFINETEELYDAAVRELIEETGLRIPESTLKTMAKAQTPSVFSKPDRSLRGRTITHVFYFHLDDSKDLPRVKGSDDAEKAQWIPLAKYHLLQKEMFEDHFAIIAKVISK